MNSTENDQAKRQFLLADAEGGRNRRRVWVAAAVAAAAVAAAVVWAMSLISGNPVSVAPRPAGAIQPEHVAVEYVHAYASYDRPRLESVLGGQALANWASLSRSNRADEAMEFRILLDSCTAVDHSNVETRVNCAFDVHALGSERLGLGPYSNNLFVLSVRAGKIISSEMVFDYGNNGFAVEMWEPFAAWVTEHYPRDVPKMYAGDDARPDATSVALWRQHIADYVAVKSS